jgi:ParB family transcriptional regulator, chromosome partitioning protein
LILDEEQQNQVAQLIVAKNLSVRETEKLVERIKTGKNNAEEEQKYEFPAHLYHDQVKSLSQHLQAAITLKPGKSGKGSLVIHYDNEHSLQTIIEQLINATD